MNTYGGVEIKLQVFLNSTLDECEWLASCSGTLPSWSWPGRGGDKKLPASTPKIESSSHTH
jgi:hypothetical protein